MQQIQNQFNEIQNQKNATDLALVYKNFKTRKCATDSKLV